MSLPARSISASPSTPAVPDLAQIFEPVRDELSRVEREFTKYLESRVELIPQMGRYIQMSGGKRVRPAVLLLSARMCGYTGDKAVLNAAVVEFIHTATLVHDDIIDEAETRRGRLAAHSRWGNDVTVLLGDYLYIRSMAMALTQDTLEVVRLLCDVTLRMIEGELYQLTKTGDATITEDEHFEIIRRKTAFLFSGCAEIGGLLGNCSDEQRIALREYGFDLGIAFQIVDDVLDYTADERALGKPIGGDLREGKVTLPVILLLQKAGPETVRPRAGRGGGPRRHARGVAHDQGPAGAPWRRRRGLRARRHPRPPRQAAPRHGLPALDRTGRADGAHGLRAQQRSLSATGQGRRQKAQGRSQERADAGSSYYLNRWLPLARSALLPSALCLLPCHDRRRPRRRAS